MRPTPLFKKMRKIAAKSTETLKTGKSVKKAVKNLDQSKKVTKIYIFAKNIHFCKKYTFLQKIYIFAKKNNIFKIFQKIRNHSNFYQGLDFCTTFEPLNDFFKRRASYNFKAKEFRKCRAFEFFPLLTKLSFKSTLEFRDLKKY